MTLAKRLGAVPGGRAIVIAALVAGLVAVLSACGSGEEEVAPNLAAPPTRTPVPATVTPQADQVVENFEVVSLYDEIDAFVTAAESASPLDRIDLFQKYVLTPAADCFKASWWGDTPPLEMLNNNGLNLPSVDIETWRENVDSFNDEAMIQGATDALRASTARLPMDIKFRVCMVPWPRRGPVEDQLNGGIRSTTLGSDLMLVMCLAGDLCVPEVSPEVADGYAMSYQIAHSDLSGLETPLLGFVIYYGRADWFARQIDPDAVFPWNDALTPDQEADEWTRMQDYLTTTYQDYPGYRNMDSFLYGQNTTRYPRWGGLYIGTQIVRAYLAGHPDLSAPDLMALPPETLLAESGYSPG